MQFAETGAINFKILGCPHARIMENIGMPPCTHILAAMHGRTDYCRGAGLDAHQGVAHRAAHRDRERERIESESREVDIESEIEREKKEMREMLSRMDVLKMRYSQSHRRLRLLTVHIRQRLWRARPDPPVRSADPIPTDFKETGTN